MLYCIENILFIIITEMLFKKIKSNKFLPVFIIDTADNMTPCVGIVRMR